MYLCTEDRPTQQIIVSDRNTILLRYLYQQLDKKLNGEKSDKRKSEDTNSTTADNDASTSTSINSEEPPRKQARLNSDSNSFDMRKENRA